MCRDHSPVCMFTGIRLSQVIWGKTMGKLWSICELSPLCLVQASPGQPTLSLQATTTPHNSKLQHPHQHCSTATAPLLAVRVSDILAGQSLLVLAAQMATIIRTPRPEGILLIEADVL